MREPTPTVPPAYRKAAALCLIAPIVAGIGATLFGLNHPSAPAAATASPAATPTLPAASLGSLQGRDYHVTLLSTPAGPRYTVRTTTGALIAESLTPEQAAIYFDHNDPRSLTATPALMMVPDDQPD